MVKFGTALMLVTALPTFAAYAEEPHDHDHDHQHHSHEAHVHGAWEMFAALDDARISVTVKGPIVDMLGFEAAPASDEERKAVADLATLLNAPETMVSLDQRASCELSAPVEVNLPEGFSAGEVKEHEHHDDGHHDGEHHAHDHDAHDIHDSDIEVTYVFTCAAPGRLGAITLTGFTTFSDIETVDAVFLSDDKQAAHRLERRSQVLTID